MKVRFAAKEELGRVNELRKQVNDLHVSGRPDVFKPGFSRELQELVYRIYDDPEQKIVVVELDGAICGYAVLHHIRRPATTFMLERDYLDIDEIGVDAAHRRQGAGSAMIGFIRSFAAESGFSRIELNMWEFNREALAFYEAVGFSGFRRYLEMPLQHSPAPHNGGERNN